MKRPKYLKFIEMQFRVHQDYLEYKDSTNSTQDWPLFNAQAKCLQQCLEINDLVVNAFIQLEINNLEYYRQKGQ